MGITSRFSEKWFCLSTSMQAVENPYENRVGWGTLVCETASSALSAKMFCATLEERRYHAGDDQVGAFSLCPPVCSLRRDARRPRHSHSAPALVDYRGYGRCPFGRDGLQSSSRCLNRCCQPSHSGTRASPRDVDARFC